MARTVQATDPGTATRPADWTEALVPEGERGERLVPEQPEFGLIWVVRGTVATTRGGERRDLPAGSVVAYRLDPSLRWGAAPGTRVRYSGRPVRVAAGGVQPWTSDLTIDVPQVDAAQDRRTRRFRITLTIALAWTVAIAVAWCYSDSQALRGQQLFDANRIAAVPATGFQPQAVALLEADGLDVVDPSARETPSRAFSAKLRLPAGADVAPGSEAVRRLEASAERLRDRLGLDKVVLFVHRGGTLAGMVKALPKTAPVFTPEVAIPR